MKRRQALSSISLGLSALVLPSWTQAWNPQKLPPQPANGNLSILADVIEGILPEGETPGGKSLKVHEFVHHVLSQCFEPIVIDDFNSHLVKANMMADELFQKGRFGDLSQKEKEKIYFLFEDSILEEDTQFMKLLKKLSIEGYMQSEYFLMQHRNYEMAPGYYHGCEKI